MSIWSRSGNTVRNRWSGNSSDRETYHVPFGAFPMNILPIQNIKNTIKLASLKLFL